jgi:hypothetical protein
MSKNAPGYENQVLRICTKDEKEQIVIPVEGPPGSSLESRRKLIFMLIE